jgi:hypothetical protein
MNNWIKNLFAVLILIFLLSQTVFAQTTYYSQDSGNFGTTSNWDTDRLGTNSAPPADFEQGDIFVIQNTHKITMDNVSNAIGGLTIESGGTFDNATNIIVFGLAGTFNVKSGGTYIESAGTIEHNAGALATVIIQIAADEVFNNIKVAGKLTFQGSGATRNFQINGALTFNTNKALTLTSATISYGASGALNYNSSGRTVGAEWPASGVPNLILQSGAVTVPAGTFEVDRQLTVIGGSLSATGTFQFDSANETTLLYAPFSGATITAGAEWPETNGPSNVTVNNPGNIVTVPGSRTIEKTLSMTAGTLAMGANNLTLNGELAGGDVEAGGTVTASGTITMGGGSAGSEENQTISGSVTLSNLTINKANINNDVTITGNPIISNGFTLTNGDLIVQGTVTISNGDLIVNGGTFTNNGTVTVSNAANKIDVNNSGSVFEMLSGATSISVNEIDLENGTTFRTGGKTITGLTTLTLSASSTFEFDGTAIETVPLSGATFGNLELDNAAGLNMNGNVTIEGNLTFSKDATVNVTSGNSLTLGTGATIIGANANRFVTGPLTKAFSSGSVSFTYPVGYASTYLPATFEYQTNSVATSKIKVEAVSGNPGGTEPTGISLISTHHHYTVAEAGTGGTFTYTFEGTFTGSGFAPSTKNRLIVGSGGSGSGAYAYPNTIAQTVGASTVIINDHLSALPGNDGKIAIASGQGTVKWDGGGGDDNWSTAANWDYDAVPQTGDIVVFDGSVTTTAIYDGGVSETEFESISLNQTGGINAVQVTFTKNTTVTLNSTGSDALETTDNTTIIFNGTNFSFGGSYDNSRTHYEAGSTVRYNKQLDGEIQADSYGNLTVAAGIGAELGGAITLNKGSGSEDATLRVTNGSSLYLSSQTITLSGSGSGSHILDVDAANTLATADVSGSGSGTDLSGFDTYSLDGTVIYNGSSAETMSADISSYTGLTINNSTNVTLGVSATVSGDLTLTNGLLNTGAFALTMGASANAISGASSTKYINGTLTKVYSGTGSYTFETGDASATSADDRYRPVTLEVTAGSGSITVLYSEDDPQVGNSITDMKNVSDTRKWSITDTGDPTVSLTLDYTNPGFTVTNHDNIRILRGTDGASDWETTVDQNASGVLDKVTVTGLSLNSTLTDFTIGEKRGAYTWDDGGTGINWTTALNWSGDVVPAAGDIVYLDHSHVTTSYTVEVTSAVEVDGITINPTQSGQTITLAVGSGGEITLAGSGGVLAVNDRGTLTIDGPTGDGVDAGSGNVSFNAGSVYNLSTGTGITTSGSRAFSPTSSTNIASVTTGALKAENYGNLTLTNNSGTQNVTGNVACENFTMDDAGHTVINGALNINGVLTKTSGTGTLRISGGELEVNGAISLQTGTITSDGTGGFVDANSTVTVNGAGAVFNFSGSANSAIAGAFNNTNGTTAVAGAGDFTLGSTLTNTGAFSVNSTSSGSIGLKAVNNNSGGTINLSNNGNVVTFGGAYAGSGSISATGSGDVIFTNTFSPAGNCAFASQNLQLQGDVTVSGGTFTPSSNTIFSGSDFETNTSGTLSPSAGSITFSGSGVQTITDGTGSLGFYDLVIDKAADNVTLNNAVQVLHALTLTKGNIITTDANLLTFGANVTDADVTDGSAISHIDGPAAKTYSSGGAKFTFPLGDEGQWRRLAVDPSGIVSTTYTAEFYYDDAASAGPNSDVASGFAHISNIFFWRLERASGSAGAEVYLHWEDVSDGVDGSLGDLQLAQWDQSANQWIDPYAATSNGGAGSGYIWAAGVTGFDVGSDIYFTIGSETGDNSLPVELAVFEALASFGGVTLNWITASELNNLGFDIYRANAETPDAWHKVNSSLIAGQGNASEETNYTFADNDVVGGAAYHYRLESVSIAGVRVTEKAVEVMIPTPENYVLFHNYPNPFNPSTNIKFQLPKSGNVKLVIYDVAGKVVRTLINGSNYEAGEHIVQWYAKDSKEQRVASGVYFYSLEVGSFRKMGKMMLLK